MTGEVFTASTSISDDWAALDATHDEAAGHFGARPFRRVGWMKVTVPEVLVTAWYVPLDSVP